MFWIVGSLGGIADNLSKYGAHCFGVDVHPRNLKNIKMKLMDLNENFPDFEIKFDVIFVGELIEHLYDDFGFIKKCKSALKPEGFLIITVPNLHFSLNRILMLFGKMPLFSYSPAHYHIYNKKIIEDILKQEGFLIEKTISSHVFVSTRRNRIFKIFEILGDIFPSFGAQLIVFAKKK